MPDNRMEVFDSFYESIASQVESGAVVTEMNHDRVHNAAIMKLMLEKGGKINMFCGCLSVFRNDFYKAIAQVYGKYVAENIRSQISCTLTEFLDKQKNVLDVVLENRPQQLLDDMIIDTPVAQRAIKDGLLRLKCINDDFLWKEQLNHFCFSNKAEMIRMEINKSEHEGLFVANEADLISKAQSTFKKLEEHSVPFSA